MDIRSKVIAQDLPCALCGACHVPAVASAYDVPGLCTGCFSKDAYRELDRVISATRHAERAGQQATLTLGEWMSVINAFGGKCALCQISWYSEISIWIPAQGLVSGNVVPLCKPCGYHKEHSFLSAMERVRAMLNGEGIRHD